MCPLHSRTLRKTSKYILKRHFLIKIKYLPIYLSIFYLPIYLSIYVCNHLSIYLLKYLEVGTSCLGFLVPLSIQCVIL